MEADRDFHDLYMMFNAGPDDRIFAVTPPRKGLSWYRLIDTGMAFPEDFMEEEKAPLLRPQTCYYVTGKSFVLLMAK
jgi:hypothetical protein